MVIRQLIKKNNKFIEVASPTLRSFEDVFDYCLQVLQEYGDCSDDIVFNFKILDSNEKFNIHGFPAGEASRIVRRIDFI